MTLPAPIHRRLLAALLLLGVVLFLFPLMLKHPLIDPDEGLHAAIAQEMVERGDYITPRFLGQPFPDKPVFFFWALAGSLRAFGFTESATRAPGLLFGLLGAVTTGFLAGAILGRRGGWLAGIFYATLSLPIGLMQMPVHALNPRLSPREYSSASVGYPFNPRLEPEGARAPMASATRRSSARSG